MELLTTRQREQLLANGKATAAALAIGNDPPDHFPVARLFIPSSGLFWLLTEMNLEGPSNTAFGLCDHGVGCPELGIVSMYELESVLTRFGLYAVQDRQWKATHPISVYATAAQRAGRIITARITLDIYAAIAKGGAA